MNMSFSLTTEQVRHKTKTITRRLGWRWLVEACARGEQPILQPVVKGQGIPKGGHVEKIGGPIRVTGARFEYVGDLLSRRCYTLEDAQMEVLREGFPRQMPVEFVLMFCELNRCKPEREITRIRFEYLMT